MNIKTNHNTIGIDMFCPSEGSYIAWKKASGKIVKLLITEDALRSSATTQKCRASKARTIAIENIDGTNPNLKTIESDRGDFYYTIGEISEVTDFDRDRWNECSTGIHHFISRNNAVNWS